MSMPLLRAQATWACDDATARVMKLCLHFARKAQVEYERGAPSGRVHFDWAGSCLLEAGARAVVLTCSAPDSGGLARTCHVLEAHVALFAKGAVAGLDWQPPPR